MKTGTADVYQIDRLCGIRSSRASLCTGELCSSRVSIKLLPHYNFIENKLVEGKARNKHRSAAQSTKGNRAIHDFFQNFMILVHEAEIDHCFFSRNAFQIIRNIRQSQL